MLPWYLREINDDRNVSTFVYSVPSLCLVISTYLQEKSSSKGQKMFRRLKTSFRKFKTPLRIGTPIR
jgi:hypothetical protein